MQRFTYTLLLLIATLTYTACVSDSTSDDNQSEKVTVPAVVEKTPPQPEQAPPPPVEEEKPTPPPAPKPTSPPITAQPTTPPPTPKQAPAPQPAPTPTPQPISRPVQTTQNVTPPPPPPPPPPRTGGGIMTFDNRTFDYGYIEEGKVINHTFKFRNTGTTPINILRAEASCGCTHPTYPFLSIEPGKTGEIGVRFDSKGKLGKAKSTITLLTDARPTRQELFLTGTVIPPKKEEKEDEKEVPKEEEKINEKDTETAENKPTPKSDSLNFTPRGPRKLPQGIPPKRQNKDGNE